MESTATISPSVFLIVLAITIAISLGAGYVARLLEERQKPADQPKSVDSPSEKTVKPDEHTALKVTLDKSLAWHLEVDGVRILPGDETAEQRARLVNIIVQIRPWIDGKAAPAPAAPVPAPVPVPQVVPVQAPPIPATVAMGTKPAPAGTPEPPKIDVMRGFRSLISSDLKNIEKSKPVSIVTMIDDFLQKRLAVSPLADQEIRLEEGSIGEVVVLIGKERYSGVDAVPDPQVQAIIRAAIKDWEKSS